MSPDSWGGCNPPSGQGLWWVARTLFQRASQTWLMSPLLGGDLGRITATVGRAESEIRRAEAPLESGGSHSLTIRMPQVLKKHHAILPESATLWTEVQAALGDKICSIFLDQEESGSTKSRRTCAGGTGTLLAQVLQLSVARANSWFEIKAWVSLGACLRSRPIRAGHRGPPGTWRRPRGDTRRGSCRHPRA